MQHLVVVATCLALLAACDKGGPPKATEAAPVPAPEQPPPATADKPRRVEMGLRFKVRAVAEHVVAVDLDKRIRRVEQHASELLDVYLAPGKIGVIRLELADGRGVQLALGGVHRFIPGDGLRSDHCITRTDWFLGGAGHAASSCSHFVRPQQGQRRFEVGRTAQESVFVELRDLSPHDGDDQLPTGVKHKDRVNVISAKALKDGTWHQDSGHYTAKPPAKGVTSVISKKAPPVTQPAP